MNQLIEIVKLELEIEKNGYPGQGFCMKESKYIDNR